MKKVLLALGCGFVFMAMIISIAPQPAPLAKGEHLESKCELPCQCQHLKKAPDPKLWDPETETYPTNYAWEKCMGVR